MKGAGLFFFLFFLVLVIAAIAWVAWTQIKARREGLPPPSWKSYIPFMKKSTAATANYPTPRATGPLDWIKDQISKIQNRRTGGRAYEESRGDGGYGHLAGSGGGMGRGGSGRGRGRALEDDAWDTQVSGVDDPYGSSHYGNEEAELGLAPGGPHHHETYGGATDYSAARSNAGNVKPGQDRGRQLEDPFGDHHEAASMRSMSPRPEQVGRSGTTGSLDSTTGTRKSAFRENM